MKDEQEYEEIEEKLSEKKPKPKDQMKVGGRTVFTIKKTMDERKDKTKKKKS